MVQRAGLPRSECTYWAIRPFQLDPDVKPLFTTPNHPSYPAAHACSSIAVATVLGYLFPRDAKDFATLGERAAESRIWAGIHYRSASRRPPACPRRSRQGFGAGQSGRLKVIPTPAHSADPPRQIAPRPFGRNAVSRHFSEIFDRSGWHAACRMRAETATLECTNMAPTAIAQATSLAAQANRAHHSHRNGTQFDQQLQTQQSQQAAQNNTITESGTAPSAGASLSTDLLRSIATQIDAALGKQSA
jgi:hypothetical protein